MIAVHYPSMYRIFNIQLDFELPLPELSEVAPNDKPTITFSLSDSPLVDGGVPKWFHHWYDDSGETELTISAARNGEQTLLRFHDLADFLLDFEQFRIQCYPFADTAIETTRHLLIDQVVPRFVGQMGNLILHASAVVLENGACIAFLGKSGWGKSTLASSFHRHGAQLISDDSILLAEDEGRMVATPSYAGARLWQDSADLIFPANLPVMAHYSDKKRLLKESNDTLKRELQAVFLINDPADGIAHKDIKIEVLAGTQMIMALLSQSFLVDVEDMATIARQFNIACQITQTNPAIYSLSYPRDYRQLADLRCAILSVVGGQA